jgi:hypothetical protein
MYAKKVFNGILHFGHVLSSESRVSKRGETND